MIKLLGILALCLLFVQGAMAAEAPSGAVYSVAPFKDAKYFLSVTCITKKFDCNKSMSDSEYLTIANECAKETLGFAPNLLGTFSKRAPYENCGLPTSYQPAQQSKSGKIQWPICCIVPKGDMCTFQCHSYFAD